MKSQTSTFRAPTLSTRLLVRKVGEPRSAAREVPAAARKSPKKTLGKRILSALRLGDKVARVATPVARVLRLDCVDPATKQLRPESKCAGRKRRWNGESP